MELQIIEQNGDTFKQNVVLYSRTLAFFWSGKDEMFRLRGTLSCDCGYAAVVCDSKIESTHFS